MRHVRCPWIVGLAFGGLLTVAIVYLAVVTGALAPDTAEAAAMSADDRTPTPPTPLRTKTSSRAP